MGNDTLGKVNNFFGSLPTCVGVALLPFMDEELLLQSLKDVYDSLTAIERQRNNLGQDILFTNSRNVGEKTT